MSTYVVSDLHGQYEAFEAGLGSKSEEATEEDKQVITDLHDTLAAHREGCVGMAANMIG